MDRLEREARADHRLAAPGGFEKSGIRVDDPVVLIAAQDEVVLPLDEAAVTLLAFPRLPDLVAQALDLGFAQRGSAFARGSSRSHSHSIVARSRAVNAMEQCGNQSGAAG